MTLLTAILLTLEASHVLAVLSVALEAPLHAGATLLREPRQLLRVLLSMGLIMPVLAVIAVASFDLLPAVKLALVALAVSPVPPIILHRTQEEQHYPMALFLTTCALSPVLAPLTFGAASWALGKDVGFGPGHLLPHVGIAIVAPLVVGWVLRHWVPASQKAAKLIARVGNWTLVASTLALIVFAWPSVIQLAGNGTFLSFALFAATGLFVGHRLGGPGLERRGTLALVTACRHPAIAVEIAHATYPGEQTPGAAVIGYVLVSLVCATPYLLWEQRRKLALGVASSSDAAVGRAQ